MKEINLTQGKVAIVDNEDYEWLNKFKWCFDRGYATRSERHGKNTKHFKMHKEIFKKHGLNPNNSTLDHKNRNSLDNRKENLRICNHSQNSANRNAYGKSSKFKGVSKQGANKFGAFLGINSKTYAIGCFWNEIDAAIAYDIFAREHHGEFAVLNFPDINKEEVIRVESIIKNPKRWGNLSRFIGVCSTPSKKFSSYLNVNKKRIDFGIFKIEEDAAKIRNEYIINNNLNTKIYKLNIL